MSFQILQEPILSHRCFNKQCGACRGTVRKKGNVPCECDCHIFKLE